MDLSATILAAAGVKNRDDRPLDGINLIPLLGGEMTSSDRTLYWRGTRPGTTNRAVREGRWKFITDSANSPGLLFDIKARHPDILRRLDAKHREWEQSVQPPKKP